MDIGVVFPYLNQISGAHIYLFECLKRWKKNNDITIYTMEYKEELYPDYEIDYNVEILNSPMKNKFKVLNLAYLIDRKNISKQLENHEIFNSHIFPCHTLNVENNVWTPQEPARLLYEDLKYEKVNFSKKVLYYIGQPILKRMDQNNYKATKTIANSLDSKKYLERIYNISIEDVIYPGVDYSRYNQTKEEKDMKKILVVSKLFLKKRVDIAIKTLAYLDETYSLDIIGDGPCLLDFKKLVEDLNLTSRVNFLSFVNNDELIKKYQKALCTIFMPYKEPFGMVALESMAAGTPVIGCRNCGGYTELIKNNYNGFLVDNLNPEIIAKKINFLSNNPEIYDEIMKNCKKTAKKYTWKETANKTMKVFEDYLDSI